MMRLFGLRKFLVGCMVAAASALLNAASVDHVQDTIAQWVDTKRVIEETRRDWAEQQRLLAHEAKLMQMELEELEERRGTLKSVNSRSDEARLAALADKDRYSDLLRMVESRLLKLETRLMGLYSAFPDPLKERLGSVIPAEKDRSSLNASARLRYLVSVLSEAGKFNRELTFVNETRLVEGQERQMKVLYWGLAAAYAIDWQGQFAQVGKPSATGWRWTDRSDFSEQIAQLIEVQQGAADAAFVGVPVSILKEVPQ
ncbi:DUF3450 family protein [Pelagicoccus sp. SDUM812005]|uniref:DUF3450 family protein n=1 Tax=Pelagicoccus sp. SDUM812005 TaxID=3041257 RepID=UPI00280C6C4A|nr:DUF3450 family protein [Pelagicoccus sp. SDUM812005]MDQ8183477.1 DUF3450 family protein [Pelagicoccus sp. SDUM812005]